MKKTIKKKLELNKATISSLNKQQLNQVHGGIIVSDGSVSLCPSDDVWCGPYGESRNGNSVCYIGSEPGSADSCAVVSCGTGCEL